MGKMGGVGKSITGERIDRIPRSDFGLDGLYRGVRAMLGAYVGGITRN
jgi:hypothetical protein